MSSSLLKEIRQCTACEPHLSHGANPVIQAHPNARLLIIGQAPGIKVHESYIPWNDASGERLREWLGIGSDTFYDEQKVAIVPMGFCYPGKGKSGDLPPRKECAELWHKKVLQSLPNIQMTLLIGQYAQNYYLKQRTTNTLTETVKNWQVWAPEFLPLPHPSPRNNIWLKKNPWFESEVIPYIRKHISEHLAYYDLNA
ncbi:IclR family transcriptional regulator [Vibrio chagasii]|uniref:uracil-DNA glycosylase family protein n=1 Tax=Vibrio TaxID=662 RepID=UPI000CF56F53|nr:MULTISPECIES: uracil-DNA glycosylase family protein [Vibrio]CAH6826726.1 IclR family transcriptional regulator [Vibrio chagasii]NOI41417.1 uracil-DNA glycosylase family protein [Vibrio sp. 070316B]NOI86372.1 uracil-DNA glycosylase family protein [Vibrio sp. 99K-1]NOI97180.1 uracil-DNA glycosylase family protein [Vibrio sp. T3Y01]PQJ57572.1 IclR family transcriptional regulator [Vibrio splendidus]